MTDMNRVEVIIDGRNFTIIGPENEEYIRDLAYFVDKKIRSLAAKNDKLSQTMAATLAALHIADELYKVKEELDELKDRTKDPLEKYNKVYKELQKAKEEILSLEETSQEYKESLSTLNKERDELIKQVEELKEMVAFKDEEIQEYKEQMQLLQDKVFNSQIELIETKKELAEYIRLLEEETSDLEKEGI